MPSGCAMLPPANTGGCKRAVKTCSFGSWGTNHGASTVAPTVGRTDCADQDLGRRRSPNAVSRQRCPCAGVDHVRYRRRRSDAHDPTSRTPWVEVRIEQVDQQVDRDEDCGRHQHDALDQRVIARGHRLDSFRRPIPGQAKIVSVITAPPRRASTAIRITVTSGLAALRKACRRITVDRRSPS